MFRASIALIVVGLAAHLWARWARRRYSIAELFELPWFMWPLARLTIRSWKREAHKDVWKAAGMVDRHDNRQWSHRYITVTGWHWRIWKRVTVLGRKIPYAWCLRRRPRVPVVRIRVARGFPQGDEDIPPGEKDPKKEVINNARGTLDLGHVDWKWHWRLVASYVVLTPREIVPREALGFDPDVAALVAKNLAADTVVPAIGKGDRPIKHSTTDDASHVLLSGTTMGGGKSETLKTFGLQAYAPSILSGRDIPGADLLILDTVRKFSHTGWAVDYETGEPWPGITIATELADAAHYLTAAAWAMERRGEITRQAKLTGRNVEWSRLLVMCDDMNGLVKNLRDGGYDDALTANSMLLWHARGVNMFRVDAFQRGSANAAGGGDNREAYGGRIWADGSDKTGDMLADAVDKKTRPRPKPHKVQAGHCVFIYGSMAFEAQRILYSDDEARDVCRREANRRRIMGLPASGWLAELEAGHDQTDAQRSRGRQYHALANNGRRQQAAHDDRQHDGHELRRVHRSEDDRQQGNGNGQHQAEQNPASVDGLTGQPAAEPMIASREHGYNLRHRDTVVKEQQRRREGGRPSGVPEDGGVMPSDPQTRLQPRSVPKTTLEAPQSGHSHSLGPEPSIQAIEAISHIDEADGEINYLTLRDLSRCEWCPYTYHSIRTIAKNENGEDFPDPVPGFSNPRRWSERAVREWCEDYANAGKEFGVYFVWKPGDTTAKIGWTGNLRGRLRRWNYHRDWVRRWVPCGSRRAAIDMETKMHHEYHDDHEELEWFRVYDRNGERTRLGRDLGVPEQVRS